ncbi:MAG: DUF3073 domain-containing protein [Mycobacterium sp.]
MGRGRAKAKQTKVARELKYSSPNTDLEQLRRELSGGELSGGPSSQPDEDRTGERWTEDEDAWRR